MGRHFKDLTGKRFNRWLVISKDESHTGNIYWNCLCDCGTTKSVAGSSLCSGDSKSCGCLCKEVSRKTLTALNISRGNAPQVGQRFTRLVIIGLVRRTDAGNGVYLCQCDCGTQVEVRDSHLHRDTKSCGCLTKDRVTTHGMSLHDGSSRKDSGAYSSFCAAKARCNSKKNNRYMNYGARGIKFLFSSFEQFFAEIGPRPEGMSLDRVNNNGNYEPGNVRWATHSQQARNKRRSKALGNFSDAEIVLEFSKRGLNATA